MYPIQNIDLSLLHAACLRAEASREGYAFVETLFAYWASGAQRFNGPGEVLCGYFEDGELVAVGGLTMDPYLKSAEMGRIRRVYVRPAWRNLGVGKALVLHLVQEARKHFLSVRLRAENADAARLYERLGFTKMESPDATHILHLPGSC